MKALHKLDPSSGLAGLAVGIVLGLLAPAALTSLSLAWNWVPLSTCLALMTCAAIIQIRHPANFSRVKAAADPASTAPQATWGPDNSVADLLNECRASSEPVAVAVRERLLGQLDVDPKLARGIALCLASSIIVPGSHLRDRVRARLSGMHAYWSGDASDLFKDDASVSPDTLVKIENEARLILASSAFAITALMNGLVKARNLAGVIPASEFRWVRATSPNLWHALSNVGRRTVNAHCLASWSHLRAEKAAGTTIAQPQLDEGIDAVLIAAEAANMA